jgi:hypothetical protein
MRAAGRRAAGQRGVVRIGRQYGFAGSVPGAPVGDAADIRLEGCAKRGAPGHHAPPPARRLKSSASMSTWSVSLPSGTSW